MIVLWIFLGVWLALPVGSWVYILILKLAGDIEFVRWEYWWASRWSLISQHSWYAKKWARWKGVGLWLAMIINDRDLIGSRLATCIRHEGRHSYIWFFLGGWGYVAYVAHSVFIFFFRPDQHTHIHNWFEIDARKFAGQRVEIPRSQWKDGPDDRVPWF